MQESGLSLLRHLRYCPNSFSKRKGAKECKFEVWIRMDAIPPCSFPVRNDANILCGSVHIATNPLYLQLPGRQVPGPPLSPEKTWNVLLRLSS